jgi:hypothetical protein
MTGTLDLLAGQRVANALETPLAHIILSEIGPAQLFLPDANHQSLHNR